jgi:metacaspase-1
MKLYKTLWRSATRVITLAALAVILLTAAGSASAMGKKYGLFVGINDYPGTENDLRGAVNDAINMRALLQAKFGYLAANTTLLTDSKATRANILDQLRKYGALATSGDTLVFQYSGHGSLIPDKWSEKLDETVKTEVKWVDENGQAQEIPLDYYDSAIVPWDVDEETSGKPWRNFILDDELFDLFTPITKKGVNVVFVSDSCHSGTLSMGEIKDGARIKFMSPTGAFHVKALADAKVSKPKNQVKVTKRAMVGTGTYLVLSAAKDNEFALDTSGGAAPSGLFTTNLIAVIKAVKTPLTYKRVIELTSPKVATAAAGMDNPQHPQLDGRFGNANLPLFGPMVRK